MHLLNTLYVTEPGSYVHLDQQTLRVELDHETRLRVPLHHLAAVVCFGAVHVSLPLMHHLAEKGIALVLLDAQGRFKARLEGAVSGNVLLRHPLLIEPMAAGLIPHLQARLMARTLRGDLPEYLPYLVR